MSAPDAIWRAGDALVVAVGEQFWVIDASGAIARRYRSEEWFLEDEHGQVHYAIAGGELVETTTVQRGSFGEHVARMAVVTGLVPVDDPDTRNHVQACLDDVTVSEEQRRLAAERAAAARIAAIDGAREDLGLGEDVARAQSELLARIERWNDSLAQLLLRTLVELVREQADRGAIAWYVHGCLQACFVYGLREPETAAPAPSSSQKPTWPLAELVHAAAVALDAEADSQEYVDANANAAQYWRAAASVRRAAALLDGAS